ncbi:MAG: hypothetical protein LBE32_00085 [Burkholderiales bacterium]|jgi:hypothetical protein|nr:hypothetical protein [Burkholderiales bacterium]
MDLRNLTLLAIKLMGLYLIFVAIGSFATNIPFLLFTGDHSEYIEIVSSPFVLLAHPTIYAVIGAILFRASGKIANCVIHAEKDASPSLTVYNLFSVAIRIVCLYFILKSLYSIVYHLAEKILFHIKMHQAYNSYSIYNSDGEASLLAATVQLAVALAIWFYAKKIAEITKKISKDE